jgi:hypothetical protein
MASMMASESSKSVLSATPMLPRGSRTPGWQAERRNTARMFFFEKMNQKTFAAWHPRTLTLRAVWRSERRSKSSLLLFFKKEDLPCFHVDRGRER